MVNLRMKMVQHSPLSPDLAFCDFFLFSFISFMKDKLREIRFYSVQKVKNVIKILMELKKKDKKGVFKEWKKRLCKIIDARANY